MHNYFLKPIHQKIKILKDKIITYCFVRWTKYGFPPIVMT